MTDGILHIDIFHSTDLKETDLTPERRSAEEHTFASYHKLVKESIEFYNGRVWNTVGDADIADNFPDIDEAIGAAISIQERLFRFNRDLNRLDAPLLVRIGVDCGDLPDIPKETLNKA